MTENSELICAYRLLGDGRGEPVSWPELNAWMPGDDQIWIHLDATHANTHAWLTGESGLSTFVIDGLLADETRPRCEPFGDGTLLILRGVNLNPDAVPEDMVSIRIWIEEHRVISTRLRRLLAVEDIRQQLTAGKGPVSTGHLVARLSARLTDRMGPVIDGLSDEVAELEEALVGTAGGDELDLRQLRAKLIQLRRVAVSLRRYIAPQRDALERLSQLHEPWIDNRVRGRIRETVDRVTRITEELDEMRERSMLIQDETLSRISQRMERTMYVLTVVATVMLPLGFLTGLLGINVGGIPGADTATAFWIVCAGLLVIVVIEVMLFKKLKWL